MQGILNKEKDKWIRPWERTSFDYIYERDDRFFSLVIKGALQWLTTNLVMYGKPIKHFIFNSGSSYMYLENNGYEYTWCETSGEDYIYMETPRCIVSVGSFSVPEAELTAPTTRGIFERESNAEKTKGQILSYNAVIQRLPIEFTMNLKYSFSNFNEGIVFIQELFECVLFQQYFEIVYLGQIVHCSIEIEGNSEISLDNIDLGNTELTKRTMDFSIKVCTNLPIVAGETESPTTNIISKAGKKQTTVYINDIEKITN